MSGWERGVLGFWISAVHGPRFIQSRRCAWPMELRRPRGGWFRQERRGGGGGDEQMSGWALERGERWDLDCRRCMGCGSPGQIDVGGQWN
jgi:hypothetical protein